MNNRKEEEINQLAKEAAKRQSVLNASKAYIQDQLTAYANTAVATYEAQCRKHENEARALLTSVILPWWEQFQLSEVFGNMREALSAKSWYRLDASNPTGYFWPKEVFSDIQNAEAYHWHPFGITAEVILDQYKHNGTAIAENISGRGRAFQNETWLATAHIENLGNGEQLYFSRWPKHGGGWGFAMTSRSYNIPIDAAINTAGPRGLHPAVLVDFAAQIQSGRVWDVLATSFEENIQEE